MSLTLEQQLKADFRNFVFYLWNFLGLPPPTECQYDIALWLQRGPRRRMVEAFRGVGKSWLTAAYVLWRLFQDCNERILVVSASKDRSDAFTIFVRRLIEEVPILQYLRPDPRKGHRDSAISFDVGPSDAHQAPSVKSVGITGQIAGSRATIIVADDVEVPKNSLTQTMRDRLSEAVKEFDAVIVPDIGEIIYLGTPQTEMSVYNKLPERGYEVRIWPARYRKNIFETAADKIAPMLLERAQKDPSLFEAYNGRGAPTDPKRFSDTDLLAREASYGRSGFALQFMLDTTVSDAERYPLKLSDLIVHTVNKEMAPIKIAWGSSPELVHSGVPVVGLAGDRLHRPMFVSKDFLEYQGVCMAIDPSGRGADETGYAVVAMLNGFLWVLEVGGFRAGYDDSVLESLARIAKRNKVKHIVIEENFGGGMFTKLLTPWLTRIYPCTTEDINSSVQKEKRIIDTLEPVMNQHRLVVDEKLIQEDARVDDQKYQLFYQMTRITRERGALAHYDRLDVLSMAVAYWVEQMDKDVTGIEDEAKAKALDEELRKFAESVLGRKPKPNNWMRLK